MSDVSKILNSTEVISDSFPKIIDAFVDFYGEGLRDFITEKLSNAIIVGYYNSKSLKTLINKKEKNFSEMFLDKLFNELGIEKNDENINRFYGSKYDDFKYLGNGQLLKVVEYIELIKKGKEKIFSEEMHKKHERILAYISDLSYEDFCSGKLSDEQLSMLPSYIRNNFDTYFSVDVDKFISDCKKKYLFQIGRVHPDANFDNVDELIQSGQLDYLVEYGKIFRKCIDEYKDYVEKNLQSLIDLEGKISEYEVKINQKYFIKALLDCKDFFNKSDQKKLVDMVNNENIQLYEIDGLSGVFGSGLFSQKGIEYFDEESDIKLFDSNVQSFEKDSIIRNRIKYFKFRGIDLGNDYDSYVNDSRCKAIWPTYDDVKKIVERFDFYSNQYNIEVSHNNPAYQFISEQSSKINLLDKEDSFSKIITQGITCVVPNLIESNGQYKMYPVVSFFSKGDEFVDVCLIHELNHVLELALTEVKNNEYTFICGWDYVHGNINQDVVSNSDTLNKREEKRNYELFNEIINHILAMNISQKMHSKGVFILSDKDNFKDSGVSSYEHTIFLIADFFTTYLDDIIASRHENNIEIIWNKVGKENFDRLNELFHIFNEHFAGFEFYKLVNDLKSDKDTERVRVYKSLIIKRDEILQDMAEYCKSNSVSL